MAVIEGTLQIGGSLKSTKRKRAIDKDSMYALRDEWCNITHNLDEIIKLAERFYTGLYASDVRPGETTDRTSSTWRVPLVTKEEVGKALKGMKIGNVAGGGGMIVYLLKEGGDIVGEKLPVLFPECWKAQTAPIVSKNHNIILIPKKEDPKNLKIYRRISLPSVVYKLFTKVIVSRIRDSLDSQRLDWV